MSKMNLALLRRKQLKRASGISLLSYKFSRKKSFQRSPYAYSSVHVYGTYTQCILCKIRHTVVCP